MTYALPQGEQMVSTAVWNGDLYIASTTRLWVLDPERGLIPVEIVTEADEAEPAKTVVFDGDTEAV